MRIKGNLRRFRIGERMHSRRLRGMFALATSIVLCGGILPKAEAQSAGLEEPPSRIHGTVVNDLTHEPIGHALVVSPDNRFATMTDDEGHFEFILPRPKASPPQASQSGTSQDGSGPALGDVGGSFPVAAEPSNRPYQLMARKPGFLNDQEQGQQSVSVGPEQKEVTISLTPEALLVGQVVLPEDSDRIVVELYRSEIQEGVARWMPAGNTVAKSNGSFRFADLKAGKYKLLTQEVLDRDPLTFDPRAQLYGYPPVYFPSAKDFASAATIELSAGNTFQASMSPIRQPYYQVRIPVANASPVAGVRVVVAAQGRPGPGFNLSYNSQEQRIEGMLPDGIYTVEVLAYPALNGAVNINVKGAALQGPPMNLVPSGSIAVNVKEEFTATNRTANMTMNVNGRTFQVKGPRRYLNIMLWPADDFSLGEVVAPRPATGPGDDSLVISPVRPGRYWLQLSSSLGYPASVTSGDTDLLRHPLVVGWGGPAAPIEITMRDDWAQLVYKFEGANGAVPGFTSNAGNGPTSSIEVPPAWIYLIPLPDSSGQFQQISMSRDGESGAQGIAPGEYRVLAFDHHQGEIEYRNPEAMRAYEGKGQVVRLVAGQKEQVTLSLTSTSESQ